MVAQQDGAGRAAPQPQPQPQPPPSPPLCSDPDPRPLAILGLGPVGRALARLLIDHSDRRLRLIALEEGSSARRGPGATAATAGWESWVESAGGADRVEGPQILTLPGGHPAGGAKTTAALPDRLAEALSGCRLIVACPEPVALPAAALAGVAVRLGQHLIDLHPGRAPADRAALAAMAPRFAQRRLWGLADAAPPAGLMAALGRAAAADLEAVTSLEGAFALGAGPSTPPALARRHLEAARAGTPTVLMEGRWRKLQARYYPVLDLPPPFGRRAGHPVFLEELRGLVTRLPGLAGCACYLCGFGEAVDYGAAPLARLARAVGMTAVAESLWTAGLARAGADRAGPGAMMRVEARGRLPGGWPGRVCLCVSHPDPAMLGAALGAVAVAEILAREATAAQFPAPDSGSAAVGAPGRAGGVGGVDAATAPPGLWSLGLFLDPAGIAAALAGLGITVARDLAGDGAALTDPAALS